MISNNHQLFRLVNTTSVPNVIINTLRWVVNELTGRANYVYRCCYPRWVKIQLNKFDSNGWNQIDQFILRVVEGAGVQLPLSQLVGAGHSSTSLVPAGFCYPQKSQCEIHRELMLPGAWLVGEFLANKWLIQMGNGPWTMYWPCLNVWLMTNHELTN